ncbi:MAG: hypothetical protein SF339_17425 [Blastocatellia bacterium]|nr:hypothetical protein [Blastocatellia bacterium]
MISSLFRALFFVALLVGAWMIYENFTGRASHMRDFDPKQVASLETEMWRSYYDRERVKLFNQLAELMRTQYHMSFTKSNSVAYQAARAAFVFKDGKKREDYEQALPHLVNFYQAIREGSDIPFDVQKAAKLELEWWIIHRQRDKYDKGDLDRALAELPAEIYQLPADRLMKHARLRQEAMTLRDKRAAAGGVSETDWKKIDAMLQESWLSLWEEVNK